MRAVLSFLSPRMPWLLTYMLQQLEYDPRKFIRWLRAAKDLSTVKKRGTSTATKRFKLMLCLAYLTWLVGLGVSVWLLWLQQIWTAALGAFIFMQLSSFIGLILYVFTYALQVLIVNPRQNAEIKQAQSKLAGLDIPRIAVLGSYGKTSMKELLLTVLSEGMLTIATPGNKNVGISHARWVNKYVSGKEDALIFEYGEAAPGDINALAKLSKPTHAVITGLAPAHLDYYPNLESIAKDFGSIYKHVYTENTLYNAESDLLGEYVQGIGYTSKGCAGWKVSGVRVGYEGTDFTLTKGKQILKLHSGLVGQHHIGPLTAGVVLAKKLRLSNQQIIDGVAKTTPYAHRMQPRHLHGAWIIDDTYNGNIEGMRAGLKLLKALPAKRKIYVTPGLVDQGSETQTVHELLGEYITAANPDQVVLMKNSVTSFIQAGLKGYKGEIIIETNPLEYYTNIEHFLAAGDLVLMQNDLPDSYK